MAVYGEFLIRRRVQWGFDATEAAPFQRPAETIAALDGKRGEGVRTVKREVLESAVHEVFGGLFPGGFAVEADDRTDVRVARRRTVDQVLAVRPRAVQHPPGRAGQDRAVELRPLRTL